jgi:predicted Zn-dependent protease
MTKERAADCHSSPSFQQLGDTPSSKLIEAAKQQLTLNQKPDVPAGSPRYDFVMSCLTSASILYLAMPPHAAGC